MSDFFEFPEPEPEPEFERPVRVPRPPWIQPPSGVLPGAVPLELRQRMLRFGVRFSDGAKVTNVPGSGRGRGPLFDREEPPGEPVMQQRGGGGGGGEWRQDFYVWPLPPAGPLTFACEWPAPGIAFSSIEVDARILIDAAARAQRIFDRPELEGYPSFHSSRV